MQEGDGQRTAAILRRLGLCTWASVLVGFSIDGRPVAAPVLAIAFVALLMALRTRVEEPVARTLLAVAAAGALLVGAAGGLAWVHGRLAVSVELGLLGEFAGCLAYAAALQRLGRTCGRSEPLRQLDRAVAALGIAFGLAVVTMVAVRLGHVGWDPTRKPGPWPNEYLQGRHGLAPAWYLLLVPWLACGFTGSYWMIRGHVTFRRELLSPAAEPGPSGGDARIGAS